MKFYAVKTGHQIGVFESWPECQKATKGFPGAEFKSFPSREEAEAYLTGVDLYGDKIKAVAQSGRVVAYCDGSFDAKRQRYSWGVLIIDPELREHEICGSGNNPKYLSTQNVAGEVLGAINSLDWAISNSYDKIRIYHDYEGLSKWISGEWKANSDVAKMLIAIYQSKFDGIIDVEFEKVKGHSNNAYNDKADELAKRALSNNTRVSITGDNWFSIPHFKQEDLNHVVSIIKEENHSIILNKEEKANSFVYRLQLNKRKLTVTSYKTGAKKLLVQGAAESTLFQIFVTYINEYLGFNTEQVFASAYRTSIDFEKINQGMQEVCPVFPDGYPESIKRLIRQSIINLNYFIEAEDYSQYAFPALKALEGHIKYLCSNAGIQLDPKANFSCFTQEKGRYILTPISSLTLKQKTKDGIEECYNFYCAQRHTLFHFGDIIGKSDSTRVVESKKEADEIIIKTINLICKYT